MRFSPNEEIKRQLLRHILDGQFPPNQALPTIEALAKTFQVSTKTVQKAIHALSAEGVIDAKRGSGLYVKVVDARPTVGRRIALLHANTPKYMENAPHAIAVVEALQSELQVSGYSLVLRPIEKLNRLSLEDAVARLKLCAAVLFEVDSDVLVLDFRELRLPLVSVDYDAYRHGVSSVIVDNVFGCFQATKSLIGQGHRHIAFMRPLLMNPIHNNQSLDAIEDERMKGYRLAMQEARLSITIQEYGPQRMEVQEALLSLLGRRPQPTAFVCSADWLAQDVAGETQRLGFRIPEDISIIGFGDYKLAYAPGRLISSVTADWRAAGASAARLLLDAMKGGPAQRSIIAAELVPRDSVAPAPGREKQAGSRQ